MNTSFSDARRHRVMGNKVEGKTFGYTRRKEKGRGHNYNFLEARK